MSTTAVATESALRKDAEKLVAEHASDDQRGFLGAQYDAGLAWVQFPIGFGGRDLSPKLQEAVDSVLEPAGRRFDFSRNPMGIGMVGPSIAVHGTDEQKAMLRPIFTAEELWCQLFSEPGAGSDVATLATRAERDGEEWLVNGQKVWTSLAHAAKWGLLLARTNPEVPKHDGLTAFLVDMHAPGVEVRPLRQMDGGASFNEVYFTDVRVGDAMRLGPVGAGWHVAVTTLMNERVSIGGGVAPKESGAIGAVLAVWRSDAFRRRSEPVLRDRMAWLWIQAEVGRLGNIRARQLREAGTPGPEGSGLKLQSALLSQEIADFEMTLLGPAATLLGGGRGAYGSVERDMRLGERRGEDPVRFLLGSQASTIAGGTTEIMRNIIGERVLGLPGEPRVDKDVAWSVIPKGA